MKTQLNGKLFLLMLTAALLILFAQVPIAFAAEDTGVANMDEVVNIPDPNLETSVRDALNKPEGDITAGDMAALYTLSAGSKGIKDLTGLEYATGLHYLLLDRNQITDITPLANINVRQTLLLNFNQIKDISPLSNMTELYYHLDLSGNPITDYAPLKNLTNLNMLSLNYCGLKDLSLLPAVFPPQVTTLNIIGNFFTDLTPLAGLNLTTLDISLNSLTDITPLANCTNLSQLYVSNNKIRDLSPLSGLPNLRWLHLDRNKITDISPLVANPAIGEINGISDYIQLELNYLDLTPGSQAETDLQTLIARGVQVNYIPQYMVDTKPPYLSSTYPAINAIDVPVDTSISISFKEDILAGANINDITITSGSDTVAFTYSITSNYRALYLKPTVPLREGAVYTVNIPAGAVKDFFDNPLDYSYTFSFTTANIPPTITNTTPAHNETNVPVNTGITVNFDENVLAGANINGITIITGKKSMAFTYTLEGSQLIIQPSAALNSNTTYTVSIPPASVTDIFNNPLEAGYTFSFTTGNTKK